MFLVGKEQFKLFFTSFCFVKIGNSKELNSSIKKVLFIKKMLELSNQTVLTAIKNAANQGLCECSLKSSAVNVSILRALKGSGLIRGFEYENNSKRITIFLKFGSQCNSSLSSYVRVSSTKRKRFLNCKLSRNLFKNFNLACVSNKKKLSLHGSLNSVPSLKTNCIALIK